MKVTNWRRKLSAALIAGGLLSPASANAAGLNTNLVTNGNFEHVDLNITGAYHSPLVLDWTGPNLFAYSHDGSSSSTGVVPDYADGADPPGAGHWYFTPNNTNVVSPTDVHDPNVYFQDINVSTGDTGAAIAAGNATFDLSAFMSSYLDDPDFGNVLAEFRNAANNTIGSGLISDTGDVGPNNVWNLTSLHGSIPVGTSSVRISLYGTSGITGRGADGYTDNIAFSISGVPEPSTVMLAGAALAATGLGLFRRRRPDGL